MKYKRLNAKELKELEKEFIHFLSSAQITGSDWEKMKKEKAAEASELIDVFSDLVYEKVMSKIEYLEFRDAKELKLFYFKKDSVELAGMTVNPGSSLDLRSQDALMQWQEEDQKGITLLFSEKAYVKERGEEIFEMLEHGCLITDNKLFNLVKSFA